jgi:hypothetical protein
MEFGVKKNSRISTRPKLANDETSSRSDGVTKDKANHNLSGKVDKPTYSNIIILDQLEIPEENKEPLLTFAAT